MKKPICLWVLALLLCMLPMLGVHAEVVSSVPSRAIHLVYDDSGSMINIEGVPLDTWCQAKYAVEVFAAMLGEKDTMNIYVMSDYEYDTSNPPRLTLYGSSGMAANVQKIHNMITNDDNTKFHSVVRAHRDLAAATADEKWLVVLTDGVFQAIDNADAWFQNNKAEDVRLVFLGMGPNADLITADESRNISVYKAENNAEILQEIIKISTKIFNRDKLTVNRSGNSFFFDVPMKELIVFAQGEGVAIQGLRRGDNPIIKPASLPVSVRYCEVPSLNERKPGDYIIDTKLQGAIATFNGVSEAGEYTVDVTNAETVEIYYKPDIEINAFLKDSDGQEVTDLSELAAGEYTIDFGFVKAGTEERIGDSSLLGEVTFRAIVTNNGTVHEKTYTSGDKITIDEGDIQIQVVGSYLEYNSVSTQMSYTVYKDRSISFAMLENVDYVVEKDGFRESTPMKVQVLADGNPLTEEQWAAFTLPEVELSEKQEFRLKSFTVEKSNEVGVLLVTPQIKNNKPGSGTYGDCEMSFSYKEKHGNEIWEGQTLLPLQMEDNRDWFTRNKGRIIRYSILAALAFLIICYAMKKKLPNDIDRYPIIERFNEDLGDISRNLTGRYAKDIASVIFPFGPQTGSVQASPDGSNVMILFKVRAFGSGRMLVTNTKEVENMLQYNLKIGISAPDITKKITLSKGSKISYEYNHNTYTCRL